MMIELEKLKKEIEENKDSEQAKNLSRFFKTGKGEYGEGDVFLGLKVPVQRQIAKKYDLSLEELGELILSKVHEHRMIALFILIRKFEKQKELKDKIFDFYVKNTKNINNWDLVDLSAPNIMGNYLLDKDKKILFKLVLSNNLWERRIAILSSFAFIKKNKFEDSLKLAEILLKDKHDLIHKAVGWMLREIGKRNKEVEVSFLKKYHKVMPRTMLRYAIEKFSEQERKFFMS